VGGDFWEDAFDDEGRQVEFVDAGEEGIERRVDGFGDCAWERRRRRELLVPDEDEGADDEGDDLIEASGEDGQVGEEKREVERACSRPLGTY
jgi:hypothetical protein